MELPNGSNVPIILSTPDRRHSKKDIKKNKEEKANELKQHNHLRFKTASERVPLGKRNFLSSLCVPVPDSQVDELYPGGDEGRLPAAEVISNEDVFEFYF